VSGANTRPAEPRAEPTSLVVSSVLNPRSVGIARYATLLAEGLGAQEVTYSLSDRDPGDGAVHFHLANSSRSLLRRARRPGAPFVVSVHDVVPRTRALLPLYHTLAYPQVARYAAAVIVHSTLAADMLIREAGRPNRLEVLPHPSRRPTETDRVTARRALGWPDDRLIAVLPGVIKSVKLVAEALAAVDADPGWRIALAGRLADRSLARAAANRRALILPDPDDRDYERAIVAADAVLCLRSGSVGETNGPLLDALGAERAVLATGTGSIPEVAGDAVRYCDGTASSIRAGLVQLADAGARAELERMAAGRAATLTWSRSGQLHAALFREVFRA
jgi:glycosyltransferase involved in cell wall biosynthesis